MCVKEEVLNSRNAHQIILQRATSSIGYSRCYYYISNFVGVMEEKLKEETKERGFKNQATYVIRL